MSIDHCQTCNTTYDTDEIEHECVDELKRCIECNEFVESYESVFNCHANCRVEL